MGNLKKILKKPSLLFLTIGHLGWLNWLSDEKYLKIAYKITMGKKPDLEHPVLYSEKLQWLKLNYRKPEMTGMVDKYEAKKYISDRVGKQYVIPALGVWDHFDEIDFDTLPDRFVLKCTHDSGGIVVCRDKSKLDKKAAKRKLEYCLRHNYYWGSREWQYKDVKPRILAEQFVDDEIDGGWLTDYKYFCFDGEPKVMYVAKDKADDVRTDFFDMNGEHLSLQMKDPFADTVPRIPRHFEEMKKIAAVLSKGFPHLRVDFYESGDRFFVGELTFTSGSGFLRLNPPEWEQVFSDWLQLPEKN